MKKIIIVTMLIQAFAVSSFGAAVIFTDKLDDVISKDELLLTTPQLTAPQLKANYDELCKAEDQLVATQKLLVQIQHRDAMYFQKHQSILAATTIVSLVTTIVFLKVFKTRAPTLIAAVATVGAGGGAYAAMNQYGFDTDDFVKEMDSHPYQEAAVFKINVDTELKNVRAKKNQIETLLDLDSTAK